MRGRAPESDRLVGILYLNLIVYATLVLGVVITPTRPDSSVDGPVAGVSRGASREKQRDGQEGKSSDGDVATPLTCLPAPLSFSHRAALRY